MKFRPIVEEYIANAINDDATIVPIDILYAMLDELDSQRNELEEIKCAMRDYAFERDHKN